MGEPPQRITTNEDVSAFQAERLKFLEDLRQFKFGKVDWGLPACNGIKSMYMELVYSAHVKAKPEEAKKFLSDIDLLADDLAKVAGLTAYANATSAVKNAHIRGLISRLDGIYLEFKRIKQECRFG